MSGKHDARLAVDGHHHDPVQHRDGKEPWCPTCELTADGRAPQRRPFGNTRPAEAPASDRTVRRALGGDDPGRFS